MNSRDHSYINNLDDLKREINAVRLRIKNNRSQLEDRWHDLPGVLVRKATGPFSVLLLSKNMRSLAGNGFNIIRRFVAGKTGKKRTKPIKLMTILAVAGFAAYGLFKRKDDI